jgi:hypothetical protein
MEAHIVYIKITIFFKIYNRKTNIWYENFI